MVYSKLDNSKNTTFIGNSAYHGGGVHAKANVDISGNATFIGNSVAYGGGISAVIPIAV